MSYKCIVNSENEGHLISVARETEGNNVLCLIKLLTGSLSPQGADGGDSLHIWRVAKNML